MFIFKYRKMQPIDTVLYCLYYCAVDYKTEDYECCIFEQEPLDFTTILPCVLYTGCPRRNVPDFGRVFLMLKYTDTTQNTYVQS